MMAGRLLVVLVLLSGLLSGQDVAPNGAERERILGLMRQYADGYISNLPNFLCDQVTRQYQGGKRGNRWHAGDTLVSKLSFHEGQEERKLDMVNGKPLNAVRRAWTTPLVTEGEFGILMDQVLGPDSATIFNWHGWDMLGGRRVAVFEYHVDKEHSTLRLSSDLARAVVPFHGLVYADPETGSIWRITETTTEIPPVLETREIHNIVDYGEVVIGDKTYLLPKQASLLMTLEDKRLRNELEYQAYRKFETGSTIRFGDPEAKP